MCLGGSGAHATFEVSRHLVEEAQYRGHRSAQRQQINSSRESQPRKSTPSEIWRVYEETQGMPLPGGELGQTQIKEHLGPNVNVELGNHILRVLQYRRHSGSLSEEGLVFPAEDNVSEEVAEKALDYLRLQDPMDEVAASERWAEEEAARMEDKFIQGATRVGLYARTPEEEQQQQGTAYGRERTGTSVLDRIKERHEIKMKEKEKEREERAAALEAEENSGTLQAAGQTGELAVRDKPEWVKYWEEKAAVSSATEAPDTGFFRRVLPSAIVAAAIVGGCVLLSSLYAPPSKSARLWPDTPPSAATHITLVGLNTLVFLLWKFPPAWPTLNRYFLQVPGYPIALSVIGNVFSHQTIKHLVFNMLVLCAVGPQLHDQVGRGNFLAIYLASGALGSMSSLASYALRRNFTTSSFGASGAVCGIVAARCLLVPSTHLGVPMTDYKVPFTSTVLLGCLISGELVAMYVKRHRPTVDYVAHLGGYATGIAGSLGLKRRFEERRRLAAERNPFTKVFGAHNGRDSKP